jgi:hypothetical protein
LYGLSPDMYPTTVMPSHRGVLGPGAVGPACVEVAVHRGAYRVTAECNACDLHRWISDGRRSSFAVTTSASR